MNTTCPFLKKLSLYIDRELPENQADHVRQHIVTCHECQQALEKWQFADHMIAGLEPIEPSAQFEQKFWEKINSLKDKRRKRWSFLNSGIWGLRPALAAAAAAVIVVAGITYYVESSSPQLTSEDLTISENLEFYSDLDMLSHLDMLEHWNEVMSTHGQSS